MHLLTGIFRLFIAPKYLLGNVRYMKKILNALILPFLGVLSVACNGIRAENQEKSQNTKKADLVKNADSIDKKESSPVSMSPVDTASYDKIIHELANGDTSGK